MPLTFTSEQEELRAVVRKFLATHSDETQVRAQMGLRPAMTPSTWKLMADQLGVQSIAIPGGVRRRRFRLRRALRRPRGSRAGPALLSVVLDGGAAATTLLESGDDGAAAGVPARHRRRPHDRYRRAHRGERRDGARTASRSAPCPMEQTSGSAARSPTCWTGPTRTWSSSPPGPMLGSPCSQWMPGTSGVAATALSTLDQTRRLATLTFSDAPAKLLGIEGQGWEVLSRVLDIAAAGLACEQVGGAARVLESTVDYVKVREQFGRPIGSFQAVKHKLADMLVELESARSAAYYAILRRRVRLARPAPGGLDREGLLLDGLLPHRGREHPAPRRHRVHLGAPGAPVLQARQGIGDPVGLARPPPRAHRPAAEPVGRSRVDISSARWTRPDVRLRARRRR